MSVAGLRTRRVPWRAVGCVVGGKRWVSVDVVRVVRIRERVSGAESKPVVAIVVGW